MRISARNAREGMTLLEVLLALVIFLTAIAAITQLFTLGTSQATDIKYESQATRLAQSKLAEFVSGVYSLQTAGDGDFSDEKERDWKWHADISEPGTAANLYLLTITVSRDVPGKGHVQTALTQYVFDPTQKGYIVPPPALPSAVASAVAPSSSSGSQGGGSSGGGGGAMAGKGGKGGGKGGGGATGGKTGGGATGGTTTVGGTTGGATTGGATGGGATGGGATGGATGGGATGGATGGTSKGGG